MFIGGINPDLMAFYSSSLDWCPRQGLNLVLSYAGNSVLGGGLCVISVQVNGPCVWCSVVSNVSDFQAGEWGLIPAMDLTTPVRVLGLDS